MRGWMVFLWAVVVTLVLIIVGIFGTLLVSGRITLGAEPSAAPTPQPTVTGVVDTSYSVVVLNGTSDAGLAAAMRDTIVKAGWPSAKVQTADSDTTDFETTTVYYRQPQDEQAAVGLADAMGGAAVARSDFLQPTDDPNTPQDESSEKRLVVVIGADRAATQPTARATP